MNNLMIFEGNGVEVFEFEGKVLFELYSTGMALGYTTISKDKIYPHKTRIHTVLTNAEISTVVHGVQQYITEEQLYDFMLEARTEKCRAFRRWVTDEVLPQIRQTGGYIPVAEEDSEAEIMAKALLVAHKTIERKNEQLRLKERQVQELAPKAEVFDMFVDKEHTLTFREIRKEVESALSITIKETILKQIMRDMKLIGKTVKASQYAIRNGFAVTKDIVDNQGKTRTQDRFTMKTRNEILKYINEFPHML